MSVTTVSSDGLKIPVFTLNSDGSLQHDPENDYIVQKRTILQNLFSKEELEGLALVRLGFDPNSTFRKYNNGRSYPLPERELHEKVGNLLDKAQFGDGTSRAITFSSGNNFFYADPDLKKKISSFYASEPDSAYRYGSLLSSDCLVGNQVFEQGLRVKFVDFTNPEYEQYRVGDCHGKVRSTVAKDLNAKTDNSFQFRFAWRPEWGQAKGEETGQPLPVPILAKGTLLVDDELLDREGVDLILDISSIKGIKKDFLKEGGFPQASSGRLVALDTFTVSKCAMGVREVAEESLYNGSWQFNCWFSPEAIQSDMGEVTLAAAQELAEVQRDPITLKNYLVEQYDKQQEYAEKRRRQKEEEAQASASDLDNSGLWEDEVGSSEGDDIQFDEDGNVTEAPSKSEMRMISILRADTQGQLLEHPKVAKFMEEQVAKKWRDLAVKGGFKFDARMAAPAPLPPGCVCIPGLADKEDVIVSRYPIIHKGNIRVCENITDPDRYAEIARQQATVVGAEQGWSQKQIDAKVEQDVDAFKKMLKGNKLFWINPEDAALYFQMDFDGDKAIFAPASKLPTIAKECFRAGEERLPVEQRSHGKEIDWYKDVNKRSKKSYAEIKDIKYTPGKIAFACTRHKVGQIANAIGRVRSSVAEFSDEKAVSVFMGDQFKLLERLWDAMQVEVDYTKSANRHEDFEDLKGLLKGGLGGMKQWKENHPVAFFDHCTKQETYRDYRMPVQEKGVGSVNVLPRLINPCWEACQIVARTRDDFRHIVAKRLKQLKESSPDYHQKLEGKAKKLKTDFDERRDKLKQFVSPKDNPNEFKEGMIELYESARRGLAEECSRNAEFGLKPEEYRLDLAAFLFHAEHAKAGRDEHIRACGIAAKKLETRLFHKQSHKSPKEAEPREAYVIQVPFGAITRTKDQAEKNDMDVSQDDVLAMKSILDGVKNGVEQPDKKIKYDAIVHETLPYVEFVIHPFAEQPNPKRTINLLNKWNHQIGDGREQMLTAKGDWIEPEPGEALKPYPDLSELNKVMSDVAQSVIRDNPKATTKQEKKIQVVAPPEYRFAHPNSTMESGKASLSFNLFTEELCQLIKETPIEQVSVKGSKHNDFKDVDWTDPKWQQPFEVKIGRLEFDASKAQFYRWHNTPVVMIDDKVVGMIHEESCKLPVGTTFLAQYDSTKTITRDELPFKVIEGSLQIPEPAVKKSALDNNVQQISGEQANSLIEKRQQLAVQDSLMTEMMEIAREVVQVNRLEGQSVILPVLDNLNWKLNIRPDGNVLIREEMEDGRSRTIGRFSYTTGEVTKAVPIDRIEKLLSAAQAMQPAQQPKEISKSRKVSVNKGAELD